MRTLKPVNPSPQDEFWNIPEEDVAVYVTKLGPGEAKSEQIAILYRKRADADNVFDELKNQWGFRGYCSQKAVVTEAAARLVLLACNLWTLLVRLLGGNRAYTPRQSGVEDNSWCWRPNWSKADASGW